MTKKILTRGQMQALVALRRQFSLSIPRQPDIEATIIAKKPGRIVKRRHTDNAAPTSILKRTRAVSVSPKRVSFKISESNAGPSSELFGHRAPRRAASNHENAIETQNDSAENMVGCEDNTNNNVSSVQQSVQIANNETEDLLPDNQDEQAGSSSEMFGHRVLRRAASNHENVMETQNDSAENMVGCEDNTNNNVSSVQQSVQIANNETEDHNGLENELEADKSADNKANKNLPSVRALVHSPIEEMEDLLLNIQNEPEPNGELLQYDEEELLGENTENQDDEPTGAKKTIKLSIVPFFIRGRRPSKSQ